MAESRMGDEEACGVEETEKQQVQAGRP